MNHLCKRSFSLIMAILMVLSLIPANPIHVRAEEASTANVAQIGDTQYESLQAAIDAAGEGATITLVSDIELTEGVVVPADKTVTLDLAGKTISQSKECTASYEMILNKGNLTITGDGKISFKDTSAGDPSFGWGSYTIRNEGTLVVENGTIEHLGEQNTATAVNHMYCAIFQYSGSTTIKGGKISTPTYRSVRLWKGDMTIEGGDFEGQVWVQAVDDTAKLTIAGGTFAPRGADGSSVFITNENKEVAFAVTGGTFTTKIGASKPENLAGAITGGTFAEAAVNGTDPALLGEGMEFSEDGKVVSSTPAPVYVAEVNGTSYESMEAAFAAAATGDTIKLLADVTFSGQNAADKLSGYVIDLNDKTMTLSGNTYLTGETTIKNGNIVVSGFVSDSYICLYTAATKLTLDDVNLTGTMDCYAVLNGAAGSTLIIKDSTIDVVGNVTNPDAMGNIIYGGNVTVDNSTIKGDKTVRGIGFSNITIQNGSSVEISNVETGLNCATVTVDNSTVTITNATKRAVRLNNNALTLQNGATLTATDCAEGIIGIGTTDTVSVSSDSTLDAVDKVTPVPAVAKVGNTEYTSIDEAIAAWTNGTTLTLLADVTLTDVITLKSTENHTLNLGTYTMTAASGKNAIEITCEGRSSASYALTINADATNPGGINAPGKACIYYRKTASTKDRPIIVINNGVFDGSYSINSSSSNGGTNCPQYWINGGTFNAYMNLTKAMLITRGGYFNCSINCTGDVSAYRQISGGTFKDWQFMTTGPSGSEYKFNVGSAKNVFDVGVYVDDNGYLVVGGPVITEPGTFEASSTNYGGWSSYLQYSSAKENGLYYTSVEEALADNNKTSGVVTVYANQFDMTGISYKGTIIADGLTKITNAPDGLKVVDTNGNELSIDNEGNLFTAVAQIGEEKFESVADALAYAKEQGMTDVEITLIGETESNTTDSFDLPYTTLFNSVTFKQEDPTKTYYLYDLYTGVRTNGGKFIFDGVNITVTDQYMFEGNVELINNSKITSTADANCFFYYADVIVNGGSSIKGVIEDIRGGTLTIDGGKTDGTYAETPSLQDAIFTVNWADSNLVLQNGAYVKINAANEVGRLTVNGTLNISNSKLDSYQWIAVNAGATLTVNGNSTITTKEITGAGKLVIDATGMTAGAVATIDANASGFTGTIEVINNDGLEAKIVDGKIVLVETPAIMVTYPVGNPVYPEGKVEYYNDMLEAVPYTTNCPRLEGATITLLKDTSGAGLRFMENGMVFDLNGHTYTITAGTGSQGTNTSGFQIRPEVTTNVIFKNGTIKVAEGAPVVWMFNCYATDFIVENVTVDCTNMAWSYGESCYVAVSRSGDNVQFVGNTKVENFNSEVAGAAINVGGTMTIGENVIPGGSIELDAGATLTAPAGLDVVAADGYKVVYENGAYVTKSTTIEVSTKAELDAALNAAEDGDTIILTADIESSSVLAITKAITLDLGGHKLTTTNGWGGLQLKNGCSVKNGTLLHTGRVNAIKAWDVVSLEDLVIEVTDTTEGKTVGGIAIQENAAGIDSIKNVTLKGVGLDYGIETVNCGNAQVIGTMENVNIDAVGTGMLISAPCGTATNCSIKGGVNGIEIWIKGTYSASLDLFNSTVEGGVYAHDEFSSDPSVVNNGTLSLTVDDATTGASAEDVTLTLARAENVEGVIKEVKDNAKAKVNGTYYATLAKAIAAAQNGDVITLLADCDEDVTVVQAPDKVITIDGAGKTMTGTITVDGKSAAYATAGLTIKNVKFDATNISKDASINLGGSNSIRYTSNVTVTGCTFTGTGNTKAAIKNYTGGCKNLTVTDCTATGVHSLVQVKGVDGLKVTNVTVNGKNGIAVGTSTNVVIDNANITATGYGVRADGEGAYSMTVKNSTITANDPIVVRKNTADGYQLHVEGNTLTGNNANGYKVTFTAGDDGVYVTPNVSVKLSGTNVEDVFPAFAAKIGDLYYASLQAAYAAAEAGDEIVMLAPAVVAAGETLTLDKDVKIVYTSNVVGEDMFTVRGTLNVAAGTITYINTDTTGSNVTVSTISCEPGSVLNVTGGTIENKTVKADGSSIYSFAIDLLTNGNLGDVTVTISGGTVYSDYMAIRQFNNGTACKNSLTISGGYVYGAKRAVQVHMDNTAAYTTISGGKIEGGNYALCLFAKNNENLTVSGGEFLGDVYSATNGFITGGTFDAPVYEAYCAEGYIPTANGDGTYGVKVGQYVAQIGEKKYETLAEAFTAAQPGDEVKILVAGTYALSTSGKNITITGAVDGVVFEGMGAKNMGGASVTFNNVTFNWTNANYTGLQHCGDMKYNNCTINGQPFLYGTSEIFNNCTFNQTSSDAYNVWTYGAKNVEFNGCTFNSAGKSVLIYSEQTDLFNNVTVTNSTFKASAAVDGKAAIEMDSSSTSGIKLTIDSATTATGFGSGNVSGNSLWNNKKGSNTDANNDITVVVNGETVLAPVTFVAQVNDGAKYESLQAAIEAAQNGDVITVVADHELVWNGVTNVDGLPVIVAVDNKTVTIDLNGHKLTGSSGTADNSLYAAFAVDNDGSLTLKDSVGTGSVEITGTYKMYSLLLAYEYGANKATKLIVESGSYYLEKAHDSLIFCGEESANSSNIVYINGGNFKLGNVGTGENGKPWIGNVVGAGDNHINVFGGTFNADVNRQHWSSEVLVSETCYTVKNTDGTWTVNEGAVAYVATGMLTGPHFYRKNVGYATIEEAIEAAVAYEDGNITLLANVQLTKDVEISIAGVVLNTNGHTFNGNGHKITLTAADATLTAPAGLNVITNVADYKVQYVADTYKLIAKVYVAQVNAGAKYESLAEAIDKAQPGDTITLLGDVTEDVTISKNLTIDGAGKTYTGHIAVKDQTRIDVTIKNVNFDGKGYNGYAVKTDKVESITVENCTVTGYDYGFLYANTSTPNIVVKNVTVTGGSYGLRWISGTDAIFENVTMTGVTYGIQSKNTGTKTITLKNCVIDATDTALAINEGGTATNTFVFEGLNTISSLTDNQYAKYVGATIVGTNYYGDLNAMIGKADNDQTIKLLSDIDLSKVEMQKLDGSYDTYFLVEGKSVTIDLNEKTISGEYTGSMLVGVFSTDKNGKLTLTGNGTVDVTATGKVYTLITAFNDGSYVIIENGTYKLDKASDSLIYYGGNTDAELIVKGGTFTLGNVGEGENGKPWIFNVLGAGDHHIRITGGTFNADINRQHWSNEAVVDKTCYVVENDNGTWTVKDGAVAYVTTGMTTGPYFAPKDIGYATIEEAFAAAVAADDKNITLLKDVQLAQDVEISIPGIILNAGNYKLDCGDHKIILTDVAATLTAPEGLNVVSALETHYVDYVDGTYKLALYVAQNVNTGKYYETVNDALDEVASGQTVKMLDNSSEVYVIIDNDVTLDLNGYELTARGVVAFEGSSIVDGSEDNTGLLKIAKNKLVLDADNEHLPVWNADKGGYQFAAVSKINRKLYDMDANGKVKYAFMPLIDEDILDLLKKGGEESGVSVAVRISWMSVDNEGYEVAHAQDFVFSDEMVKAFMESYNNSSFDKMFTLTVGGLEGIGEVTFCAVIKTASGVEIMAIPRSATY